MDVSSQSDSRLYEPLSKRELEILALIAEGLSNREIADRLVVAHTTVKWYIRQIFNKLAVNSREEAIERASALGLVGAKEAAPAARHSLPAPVKPFIGRERELADLARLLHDERARLVTILAPGGMGKTRLALAVAESFVGAMHASPLQPRMFPDGVYFVPLAPLTAPDGIVPAIADATGFQFAPDHRTPAQQLLDFLRHKRLLLVLDNFEHLLDDVPLVMDLLHAAPGVAALVTSRERLNVTGESVYRLGGMAYPDQAGDDMLGYSAVQLFVQSARRARADFATEAAPDGVVQICRLTQGMPLALELAAARVGALSPAEIVEEITRGLDFLQTEMRDMPERLRSVRAVFESAWTRLTDQEQAAFRRLSVFRGGCTREAAQAITGADLMTLTALVDKALLRRQPDTGRYEVHELLRQYAAEQLTAAGEVETTRDAHSACYLNLLHQRQRDLEGGRQLETLREIASDIENVRAARLWAAQQGNYVALDKALRSLWLFYLMRGQFEVGMVAFEQAADVLRQQPIGMERDTILGLILAHQACLGTELSQIEKSERLLEESRTLLRRSAAPGVQAFLAVAQGRRRLKLRTWAEQQKARALFEQALALYRQAGDRWGTALALCQLGSTEVYRWTLGDDIDILRVREILQQALALEEELDDIYLKASTLRFLGTMAEMSRVYKEAEHLERASFQLARQLGNPQEVGRCLNHLGFLACSQGKMQESTRYFEESLAVFQESGDVWGVQLGLSNVAAIAYDLGNFTQCKQYSEEGLSLAEQFGNMHWIGRFLPDLALAARAQGDFDNAEACLLRAKAILEANDNKEGVSLCLLDLADVALAQGRINSARQILEEAMRIAQELQIRQLSEICRVQQGKLAYHQGDYQQARQHLETSLAYFRSDTVPITVSQYVQSQEIIRVQIALAKVEYADRQIEAAYHLGCEAVKRARAIENWPLVLAALAALADVLLAQSQPGRAAETAAFVRDNPKACAADRARSAALLDALQKDMSQAAFKAALERGQLLELDEAVRELLSDRSQ